MTDHEHKVRFPPPLDNITDGAGLSKDFIEFYVVSNSTFLVNILQNFNLSV